RSFAPERVARGTAKKTTGMFIVRHRPVLPEYRGRVHDDVGALAARGEATKLQRPRVNARKGKLPGLAIEEKGGPSRFFRAITRAPQTESLARGHPWQNLKPALSASAPTRTCWSQHHISLVAKNFHERA